MYGGSCRETIKRLLCQEQGFTGVIACCIGMCVFRLRVARSCGNVQVFEVYFKNTEGAGGGTMKDSKETLKKFIVNEKEIFLLTGP